MKAYSITFAALCLAASASPVMAIQASDSGSIDDRTARSLFWLNARDTCDKARKDERLNEPQRLAICKRILAQIMARAAAPETSPKDGFERNFYWLGISGLHTSIMGSMGKIDKVRSQRVCEQVMAADAAKAKIDVTQWPAKYSKYLEQDPTEVDVLAVCKKKFPAQ